MFRRVIVGVDGGPGGRDAVALARLMLAEEGAITLAHVPARVGRAESRSVARRLHRLVDTSNGDLLVVGSSRRGVWGRTLLGDDTRATIHGAPCAVAVAPQGYDLEQPVLDRIGVGCDESPESERALAVARVLAEQLGAELTAFQALPVAVEHASDDDRDQPSSIVGAGSEVGYGEPSVELAFFSDSVDLLVVGTRDEGVVGRMLHGSTAGRLARSAGCPLLVVPGRVRTGQVAGAAGRPPVARPVG